MLNASKKTTVTVELTPPFTVAELGRAFNILDRELSQDAQLTVERGAVNGKVTLIGYDQPTIIEGETSAAAVASRGRGFATPTDLRDTIAAEARKVLG